MKFITISLAFLLLVLGIAYAQNPRPASPQATQSNVQAAASAAGRYQIVFSPLSRADTFLVDTQTGKIWQRTSFPFLVGEPEAWIYQTRLDNEREQAVWELGQTHKKEP